MLHFMVRHNIWWQTVIPAQGGVLAEGGAEMDAGQGEKLCVQLVGS